MNYNPTLQLQSVVTYINFKFVSWRACHLLLPVVEGIHVWLFHALLHCYLTKLVFFGKFLNSFLRFHSLNLLSILLKKEKISAINWQNYPNKGNSRMFTQRMQLARLYCGLSGWLKIHKLFFKLFGIGVSSFIKFCSVTSSFYSTFNSFNISNNRK